MNRVTSSRQTIAAKQRNCNYHPDGRIAQHVLDTTIYDDRLTEPLVLKDDRYFVASKFAHRYYVVLERAGTWQCSSRDETVAARCIAQAKAYFIEQAA